MKRNFSILHFSSLTQRGKWPACRTAQANRKPWMLRGYVLSESVDVSVIQNLIPLLRHSEPKTGF